MTDAQDRVPNAGEDVDDATEPDPEYDQLGSGGNPFERIDPPGSADATDEPASDDSDADFGMGIPSANDPQALPEGPGPT